MTVTVITKYDDENVIYGDVVVVHGRSMKVTGNCNNCKDGAIICGELVRTVNPITDEQKRVIIRKLKDSGYCNVVVIQEKIEVGQLYTNQKTIPVSMIKGG